MSDHKLKPREDDLAYCSVCFGGEIELDETCLSRLEKQRDALLAENAEFRKDKERLDWLDSNHLNLASASGRFSSGRQPSARQAIDAAREATK